MLNLEKILPKETQLKLVNVNYSSIDLNNEDSNFTIHCQDSLETKLDKEHLSLSLLFTRNVFIKPRALFELTVTFEAVCGINDDYKEDIGKIDFNKEILENGEDILMLLASKSSLLVAQITSASGQNPIITPPNFIIDND
jgi:hypothetical protein